MSGNDDFKALDDHFADTFTDVSLSDTQQAAPKTDIDGYQAVIWYGITSILNAAIALTFYLIWRTNAVIASYYPIMLTMQICYWPVAIAWAGIALFDSAFTRELMKGVVSLSVLGPFAGEIVGFVFLWVYADGNNWIFDQWYFWFLWPMFLGYDIGQMLLQILFVPEIMTFLDTAPLKTKTA